MLGKQIRELRKAAKMKACTLAKSLGISRITLWRLEAGQRVQNRAALIRKAAKHLTPSENENVL